MASLQFRYDGYGRPERGRNMGFFPPRYYFHNYYNQIPEEASAEKSIQKLDEENLSKETAAVQEKPFEEAISKEEEKVRTEVTPKDVTTIKDEVTQKEKTLRNEGTVKEENTTEKHNSTGKKESKTGNPENFPGTEEMNSFNVSEKLITNLTATETNLTWVKGQVDSTKSLLDDIMYKLESFMQIMEIIRANEERRISGPQAQTVSIKTSKDSVDELLELLQGPVFQNVLRQFFISTFVKKRNGTN